MLTDAQARTIACSWHGGGGSALYALCSSGAISAATRDEIDDCLLSDIATEQDADNLYALLVYTQPHATRGPVPGWAKLWDDEA